MCHVPSLNANARRLNRPVQGSCVYVRVYKHISMYACVLVLVCHPRAIYTRVIATFTLASQLKDSHFGCARLLLHLPCRYLISVREARNVRACTSCRILTKHVRDELFVRANGWRSWRLNDAPLPVRGITQELITPNLC